MVYVLVAHPRQTGNRCEPVPHIVLAETDSVLATSGSVVKYTCNRGYHFNSGAQHYYVKCDGNHWNHSSTIACRGSILQSYDDDG